MFESPVVCTFYILSVKVVNRWMLRWLIVRVVAWGINLFYNCYKSFTEFLKGISLLGRGSNWR